MRRALLALAPVLLALAALPARTRAAVVLRLHDGLDDDAAAELLGEDPAELAAAVEAALDELVPLLEEYWFDQPDRAEQWAAALRGALDV